MVEAETVPTLPVDALAAVLCRLPSRTVAASRCVCKAWRAVVDARGLLLPRALHGIFLNFIDYRCPRLFARPLSERPGIHGNLGFLPRCSWSHRGSILDHCNGLLLYDGKSTREFYVVNPATRRWAECLPPRMNVLDYAAYLVFDPAVSPHYEVFLIPRVPRKPSPVVGPRYNPPSPVNLCGLFSLSEDEPDAEDIEEDRREEEAVESPPPPRSIEEGFFPARFTPPASNEPEDPYRLMEWPPSPYTFHVFSSCTGRWEERSFIREGEPVGTVEDVRLDSWPTRPGPRWRYGVYWQGALYVHCHDAFVMRLSLANGSYQVIKTPINIEEWHHTRCYLGRSEKGVYFATVENYSLLEIWILNESYGQIEWVLKHHSDLDPYVSRVAAAVNSDYGKRVDGPWVLADEHNDDDNNDKVLQEGNYEWDSDEDDILDENGGDEEESRAHIDFLGFHPYKEIVFLMASFIGIAYHLNTSKVQYLGKLRPNDYDYTHAAGVYESFPYTPCMTGHPQDTIRENYPGNQQYT